MGVWRWFGTRVKNGIGRGSGSEKGPVEKLWRFDDGLEDEGGDLWINFGSGIARFGKFIHDLYVISMLKSLDCH